MSGHDEQSSQVVLVADDDPTTRLLLTTMIANAGFSIIEAADGQTALSMFDEARPDLVLLDVEMPLMDGYAACAAIRSRPDGRDVPIVMVTAHEDTVSIEEAYEAGATDFIVKPINRSLLLHRLRYVMRGADTYAALKSKESENRALLEGIPDLILILSEEGTIERVLNSEVAIGDAAADDLGGCDIREILPEPAAERALSCIRSTLSTGQHHALEFETTRSDGTMCDYETRFVTHRDGRVLCVVRDVSERKLAEAKIHQLAYYDTLTGLPNRQMFLKYLDRAIADSKRDGTRFATLYIDLDRFKRVNDTLGHGVGDFVLKRIAERLSRCVRRGSAEPGRPSGELGRLGGDEFVLLLTNIKDDAEAMATGQRIRKVLAEPIFHEDREFVVTPSIGISIYPKDGEDMVDLLKNADSAMYEAKASGRNGCQAYLSSMNAFGMERLDLESELRRAIENDELEVYYQPKFNCRDLNVVGAEALVRWFHPQRGAIPTESFIGIAEESRLIAKLDQWVAAEVGRQIARWQRAGLPTVPIAINVSGHEFCHGDPGAVLASVIEGNSLAPGNLELEITESVLMADVRSAGHAIRELKDYGFSLAVDDFGTGYSSLNYLKRFELDILKIDKSFVSGLGSDTGSEAICEAIISMAHDLGLRVVAEGVENHAQLAYLRTRRCDQVQGYLLSRPLAPSSFTELLTDVGRQTIRQRRPAALRAAS